MELKYKEIKYLNHIFRNIFLYFFLFVAYLLIFNYEPSLFSFFKGLFIYVVGYSTVYFFNDYADRKEDNETKKRNLYLDFKNKTYFWITAISLIILGIILSYSVSVEALILLIAAYALNYFYSFKPFRFRDAVFIREANIFFVYFIKWFLISACLGFGFKQGIPWPAIIMGSAFASVNLTLYKRHVGRNKFTEYFFGSIFLIFLIVSIVIYKNLYILIIPPLFIAIYLSLKYKREQIPIGKYQFVFFIYLVFLYATILFKHMVFP
jgi:hypothetical protein